MIIVNFPAGINEINIPALNQWDYGQKIAIHGLKLPQITEVHFCDKTCDKALVRLASKILDDVAGDQSHSEVTIPDVLLENPHAIHAFIFVKSYESAPGVTETTEGTFYTKDGDNYVAVTLPGDYAEGTEYYRECGKVTYKINIPVNARTQPDGYPCEDASVQNFLSEALGRINDAAAVVEETANKSAKIYNIKDGRYYDTWMGSKEDYEKLTQEQKEAANTLFIYDNKLKEQLESGEFVVGKAELAKTAEKTDFSNAEWKECWISRNKTRFYEGKTYQVMYLTLAGTMEGVLTFTVPPTLETAEGVDKICVGAAPVYGDAGAMCLLTNKTTNFEANTDTGETWTYDTWNFDIWDGDSYASNTNNTEWRDEPYTVYRYREIR